MKLQRFKHYLQKLTGRMRLSGKSQQVPVSSLPNPGFIYSIDSFSSGAVDDGIKVQGWLYAGKTAELSLEVDGQQMARFFPDLKRTDVCAVHDIIPKAATPGFDRRFNSDPAVFNARGASLLQLYAHVDEQRHLLCESRVFHRSHYPAAQSSIHPVENFYLTVGSSNIDLGGFGDFYTKLGPFSIGYCQLGFMVPLLYMRSTQGRAGDWSFDPNFDTQRRQSNGKLVAADNLASIFAYAKQLQVPCVIGLNGGVWGDASGTCPEWDLIDHLEEDPANCQWNQNDEVMPDDYLKHLTGAEHAPELSRALTLTCYNESVRQYKKRNLQQAAACIVEFARDNPGLYIGSNLDPDCYQNPFFEGEQWYDFNPAQIRQFRDWLAGRGVYADRLSHTLSHKSYSVEQLNEEMGTEFSSWEEVQPPRTHPGKPLSGKAGRFQHVWEQFRRHIVHRHYSDLADWLVEAGIQPAHIFSSQGFTAPREPIDPFALTLDSSVKNYETGGMSLAGSKPEKGHIGAILYGDSARNAIRTEDGRPFFQSMRELDPDWAVVEFNPADLRDPAARLPDYAFAWDCLRQIFNHGARYLNLMAWNGNSGLDRNQDFFSAHMALRDTPLEHAVIDFMLMHADVPRGSLCYTFGSNRHTCNDGWSSTDSELQPTAAGLKIIGWPATLNAPQPYLLNGRQRIQLWFVEPPPADLQLTLSLAGDTLEIHLQEASRPEVLELTLEQPIPSVDSFSIRLHSRSSTVADMVLHRVLFYPVSKETRCVPES